MRNDTLSIWRNKRNKCSLRELKTEERHSHKEVAASARSINLLEMNAILHLLRGLSTTHSVQRLLHRGSRPDQFQGCIKSVPRSYPGLTSSWTRETPHLLTAPLRKMKHKMPLSQEDKIWGRKPSDSWTACKVLDLINKVYSHCETKCTWNECAIT